MQQLIITQGVTEKRSAIRKIIADNDNGKMFKVVNVRAAGELREYQAMLGVQAGLKGGESTTAGKANLLTVFDTTVNNYRAINLDTVLQVSINGVDCLFLDKDTAEAMKDGTVKSALKAAALGVTTGLRVLKQFIS